MKKLISIMLALCLMFTIEYSYCLNAGAYEKKDAPVISMEIGTYLDESKRGIFSADTVRLGRGKTSAKAGEKIVVTFIISDMAEIEFYQLSGHYDESYLKAGYFSGAGESAVWNYGDSEQDYNTVFDGSSNFENSFSFTRTETEPTIYLCGFSMDGSVSIPQCTTLVSGYTVSGMPLISVGFEVQKDISNIYDAFDWYEKSTYVSKTLDDHAYYLNDGLSIACKHQYEISTQQPDCENDGYSEYKCIYCEDYFRCDYTDASGHLYELSVLSQDNVFHYTCSVCASKTTKTAQELYTLWNEKYINQSVSSTAIDDSCYLDVAKDKIINAKDFAIINRIK